MNLVGAVLDRMPGRPLPGAEDFVCHSPQPIPPVDDDDDDDDEDDDRGSGGGNIDPDDDEGGFDDDDDDDEAPWTAVARGGPLLTARG